MEADVIFEGMLEVIRDEPYFAKARGRLHQFMESRLASMDQDNPPFARLVRQQLDATSDIKTVPSQEGDDIELTEREHQFVLAYLAWQAPKILYYLAFGEEANS